jgi:hypothetical protein
MDDVRYTNLFSINYAGATKFVDGAYRWSLMRLGSEVESGLSESFYDGDRKIWESYNNIKTSYENEMDNRMKMILYL